MSGKKFKTLAEEAANYTKEGLGILVEVDELLEALKNMQKTEDYYSLIKEIIEKEKMAVGFIEKATIIKRELMNKQKEQVTKLFISL